MSPPPALSSNVTDTALIFEGGGMRASYTSAAVVALLEAGIHIDYVAGISAGSSNAINYLSRDADRARRSFVEFAADPQFGDLRTFVRGQGLFNADYIYQRTAGPGQPLELDWATLRANPATLRVGAFRCRDGRQVWWGLEDAPTLDDLVLRVQASSTMPVLMPPVTIDDDVYLDGALGPDGGLALDVAQREGFDRFVVVMTRERGYVKPPVRLTRAYRQHFRRWPAVVDALLERPANYNRTREELFDLERDGKAYLFIPERMPVSNGERRVSRLMSAHRAGLVQARREITAISDFVGVAHG